MKIRVKCQMNLIKGNNVKVKISQIEEESSLKKETKEEIEDSLFNNNN